MVQNWTRKLREAINSYFCKIDVEHTLRQPSSKPFDFLRPDVWSKVVGDPYSTPRICQRVYVYDGLHSSSAKTQF